MKIDNKADQPASGSDSSVDAKNRWVHQRLTQSVADNLRNAMLSPLFSISAVFALLRDHVAALPLIAWALVLVFLTLYRTWVLHTYRSEQASSSSEAQLKQFDKHRWTWPASSLAWSGLLFLYYGKVPAEDQFLCILILLAIGGFSIFLLSARLDFFKLYVDGLVFMAITAVLFAWASKGGFPGHIYDLAVAALLVVFWILLRTAGGRFHSVQRRAYALQYDNEHLIASLRQQTETAMHAVKVKDRLLANAAHDLRQPVHALAFYADWLRNEPDLSAEVVPKILIATDSVNALFNSLFDFAKIQSSQLQVQFSSVPVSQIIDDMKVQFGPAAQAKGLEFRQRVTPAFVKTDPLLIRRILGNLLANAIRYTERGGVLLTTRVRADQLWIEVWDTGVGIAAEHHSLVFQEFYKAPSHTGTEDGFGLGLAIVQRLAQALEHPISLVSRPGRGTRIRIEIPLADKA
jgi:signal transduction histidine kinase